MGVDDAISRNNTIATLPKCSMWHMGSGCPIPGIVLAQQSQPTLGMAVVVHVPGITVTNA